MTKKTQEKAAYDVDLAFIHDAGFGHVGRAAAGVLRDALRRQEFASGTVVEFGCGSGIQAEMVTRAGYHVVGFDISPAMVELAKRRVPSGEFRCESFLDADLPSCVAVAAIGEIFNYLFDRRNSASAVPKVFRRVYKALQPGGTFLFDAALVGRVPGGKLRTYAEGDDWACLYEANEDREKKRLTRQITTFRRDADRECFRRDSEVHRLRLYERDELVDSLRQIGFRVRTLRAYGDWTFPPGWMGFQCTKPK